MRRVACWIVLVVVLVRDYHSNLMRRREDRRHLCYLRGRLPRLGALRLDGRLRLCLGLELDLNLRGCRGYLRTFVFCHLLDGLRGLLDRIDRMLGVLRVVDQLEGRLVVEGVPIVIFRLRDLRRTFFLLVGVGGSCCRYRYLTRHCIDRQIGLSSLPGL